MGLCEILKRWQEAAGEHGAQSWGEDDLYGFFQRFRPGGEKLDEALLPLPNGRPVYDRLKEIYAATSIGWKDNETSDGYFVVRNPPPIKPSEIESLIREYLGTVAEIAALAGAAELAEPLQVATFTFASGPAPESPDRHDTELSIYDTLCDWVASLETAPSELADLREAFYSIACDYPLSWYLMWPWYAAATAIEDPFQPYFQLWRHGIEYRFDGPSSVIVYVPPP